MRIYIPNEFAGKLTRVIEDEGYNLVRVEDVNAGKYLQAYEGTWWQFQHTGVLMMHDIPFRGVHESSHNILLFIWVEGDEVIEVESRSYGKNPVIDVYKDGSINVHMLNEANKYYTELKKFEDRYEKEV